VSTTAAFPQAWNCPRLRFARLAADFEFLGRFVVGCRTAEEIFESGHRLHVLPGGEGLKAEFGFG